jgi:RHS repeat-associated protein
LQEPKLEGRLIYFGKRFYNPLLQRWISPDPLAIHAPGEADLNLYAYVHGKVLVAVDPVGLWTVIAPPTWEDIKSTAAYVEQKARVVGKAAADTVTPPNPTERYTKVVKVATMAASGDIAGAGEEALRSTGLMSGTDAVKQSVRQESIDPILRHTTSTLIQIGVASLAGGGGGGSSTRTAVSPNGVRALVTETTGAASPSLGLGAGGLVVAATGGGDKKKKPARAQPNPALEPEPGYRRGKKHGIKQQPADATRMAARDNGPVGVWGDKADLADAGEKASTLKPGQMADFPIRPDSKSVVYYGDGTTSAPDMIRVRNNGDGTFHGFPIDSQTAGPIVQ